MPVPDASKYSDDTLRRICQALRCGATRRAAARVGGIHFDTLYEWMARRPDVSDAITRAEADAEIAATETVVDAWSNEDKRIATQNAQWWLERRRRKDYGPSLDLKQVPLETLLALVGAADDDDTPSIQDLRRQALLAAADAQDPTDVEPNDPQGGGDGEE